MKEVRLIQGQIALVDEEDYELVNPFRWHIFNVHRCSYAVTNNGILMHRLILGVSKGKMVDHKDNNGLNNQKDNLRECTHSQNGANRNPSKKGTSKYLGVCWAKDRSKWMAQITHKQNRYKLGSFINEIDAAKAYNKKAIELHGEFARPNII